MKRLLVVLFGVLAFGTGSAQADWIRDKAINWSGWTYTSERGKTFALYENSTVRNWKALSRTYAKKNYRSGPISKFIKSCLEACTYNTWGGRRLSDPDCSGVALIYTNAQRSRPTMCLFASRESEVMAVGGSSRQTYDFFQIVPNLAYHHVRPNQQSVLVGVGASAFDDCEIDKSPIWCRDVASSSTPRESESEPVGSSTPRESESEPVDGTPWADLTDAQKAIATPCWLETAAIGNIGGGWRVGGSSFWARNGSAGKHPQNSFRGERINADNIRKWVTEAAGRGTRYTVNLTRGSIWFAGGWVQLLCR